MIDDSGRQLVDRLKFLIECNLVLVRPSHGKQHGDNSMEGYLDHFCALGM